MPRRFGADKTLSVQNGQECRNVEEELSDPYVICHMLQLSGLFRSHPNQCVSLELAVQAAWWEWVYKSWLTYLLKSAADLCSDIRPENVIQLIANVSSRAGFVIHCFRRVFHWWEQRFVWECVFLCGVALTLGAADRPLCYFRRAFIPAESVTCLHLHIHTSH